MNYRHHYHAGNFADLLKHALLIDLIRRLRERGGAIRVLDTHAGAGLYDLSGEMAQKSKEASGGILALDAAGDPPALLGALLALVRDSNAGPTLRYYPGSPRIALAKLTKGDLYVGCELRPDDSDALKKASQGSIGAGRQTVYGDGYAAARAIGPFAKSAARLEGIVPALALQTEVSVVEAAVPAAEAEVEPVLEAAAVVVEIAPEPELVAQAEIAPEAVAEVAAEPVVAEPEVLAAPPADTPAEALIEVPVATPKVAKVRKAKPKTVA